MTTQDSPPYTSGLLGESCSWRFEFWTSCVVRGNPLVVYPDYVPRNMIWDGLVWLVTDGLA